MKRKQPKFLDGYKANFNTLLEAARHGDLALVETQDRATGALVATVAAIGEDFTVVPIARMFDGNPYDLLNPPKPGGGFEVDPPAGREGGAA